MNFIGEKILAVSRPIHVDDDAGITAEPTSSLAVDLTYEEESGAGGDVVIGRDNDKEKVMDFLLSNNHHGPQSSDEGVPILAIVGMQGIGKTTLARLVFSDKSVINQFEVRKWITVSSAESILEVVAKKILQQTQHDGSAPAEIHGKDSLGLVFADKRFLLVLDDVRVYRRSFLDISGESDLSYYEWHKLLSLLKAGAYGSKILVTSRDMSMAEIIFLGASLYNEWNGVYKNGPVLVHELKGLSEKESLSLFMKVAPKEQESNSIKEILSKCAGVPLAIIIAGRNLWISGNNRPRVENGGGFISVLKETYDALPSYLKQCMACCSLLPRDSEFNVNEVINLWKAHRFMQFSWRGGWTSEQVAQQYVSDLVSLFIFQDLVKDERGIILKCKMRPAFHDLARLVTKRCYNLVEKSNAQLSLQGDATPHVYISMEQDPLEALQRAKNARLLVFLNKSTGHIGEPHMIEYICVNLKKLRTLRLQSLSGSAVSNLLGTLRFLRHLDLSESARLEALPGSIGELLNLETLILDNCCSLKELPKGIIKLIKLQELDLSGCSSLTHLPVGINQLLSLRELDLSGCSSLTLLPTGITQLLSLRKLDLSGCSSLSYLPSGFQSLTNLETLALFVVGEEEEGNVATLNELTQLKQLNGHLEIKNLHRVVVTDGSNEYILFFNSKLQSLKLCWDSCNVRARDTADLVLRRLQPHSNITEISIQGYCGYGIIPHELVYLVKIDIGDCNWCTRLFSFEELPCIKSVKLREMRELECFGSVWYNSLVWGFFPALEVLTLNCLRKLKGWKSERRISDGGAEVKAEGDDLMIFPVFSKKIHLDVHHTPNFSYGHGRDYLTLGTLTDQILQGWVEKNNNGKGKASSSSDDSVNLQSLPGEDKTWFTSIGIVSLDQLRTLKIQDMADITSLPDDFFKQLSSLQHLEINHGRLLSTLSGAAILQHLTSLHTLKIVEFPELDFSKDNGSTKFKGRTSQLRQVHIAAVPKMESLPWWFEYLTKLEELVISKCVSLRTLQDNCISKFGSLRSFEVNGCKGLGCISKGVIIHLISNLESLKISGCPDLDLTAAPAEDITSMKISSQLRHLHIQQNDRMNHLPWWIQHLSSSLKILEILFCKNMEALPEWFPELLPLKELRIEYCGELSNWCNVNRVHLIDLPEISNVELRQHCLGVDPR